MFSLTGKTALITGASGGLGAHFAEVLAQAGAAVTVSARRVSALDEVCDGIASQNGTATSLEMDVADAGSIREALDGTAAFDVVVNNAGITSSVAAGDMPAEDWSRILQVNLTGGFLVSQVTANAMIATGKPGSIVNVASILGKRVAGHVAAYATSKAALIQMTRATALEWARYGIRVNALCPGYVETPLNSDFFASDAGQALIRRVPMRKLSQPGDLDGALLLLASDAGRMITGTEIVVDGGHLVSSL